MQRIQTVIRKDHYTCDIAEEVFESIFKQVHKKISDIVTKMNIFYTHNANKHQTEEDLVDEAVQTFLDLECLHPHEQNTKHINHKLYGNRYAS